LREHLDNLALQRLRRAKQLTPDDLTELERMLHAAGGQPADIAHATDHGLGIFIRTLVGLDRAAATEAFARYLDRTTFSANQIRFITLIIDELTTHGIVEPSRLYESPYTDHAPTGPDYVFPDTDVQIIITTLQHITHTATPHEVA
ncbi:MAG: type I restriction-modification enzyme R subunit C-terminal domain-containing protein, partial [Dermatophilaceae bacterium]